MRVLIVDDSVVFRSQIKAALDGVAQIEVAGVANNGKIALQKLSQSSIDLITLDMEMPEMSGLETIKEIVKNKYKVKIIVFSSHTTSGSKSALEALAAGAHDFVAKPSGDEMSYENAAAKIKQELVPKILQFIPTKNNVVKEKVGSDELQKSSYQKRDIDTFYPSAIVIGSSTGGPPALEKVLQGLSKPLRIPILIAQHMPPMFTATLGKRLTEITGILADEAKHREVLKPNRIYIAPGNYHLSLYKQDDAVHLGLDQSPQRNSVRPAVDVLFESAANLFANKVCGIVLTGMGEDGLLGAKSIKDKGGGILIQDKESCVVFGMPGSIFNAGAYDFVGPLEKLNAYIKKYCT